MKENTTELVFLTHFPFLFPFPSQNPHSKESIKKAYHNILGTNATEYTKEQYFKDVVEKKKIKATASNKERSVDILPPGLAYVVPPFSLLI